MQNWVTPHTEKQQPWGEAWLWAPASSSALQLQALLSLLAVTLTVGSPLSCSFLSVQVPHHLPSLSSLVRVFLPSSDLSPLSVSFLPLHTFPSLFSTIIFPPFFPPTSPISSSSKPHPKVYILTGALMQERTTWLIKYS